MLDLYISPHIDDAILSCSGMMCRNNNDIITVNIFTKPVEGTKSLYGSELALSLRRQEEEKIQEQLKKIIGNNHFELIYLDYNDVLDRGFQLKDILGPHDEKILNSCNLSEIEQKIKGIIDKHKPDRVFFPSGKGNHMDHVLTYLIGTRLRQKQVHNNICFYSDVPYTFAGHISLLSSAINLLNPVNWFHKSQQIYNLNMFFLHLKIRQSNNQKLRVPKVINEQIVDISSEIEKKIRLCKLYNNQMQILFGNDKLIDRFFRKFPVEKFYTEIA
jgi:LmbE family N-acetylglucosaminyl deacetylase